MIVSHLLAFLARNQFALSRTETGVTTTPAPSPVIAAALESHREELTAWLDGGAETAAAGQNGIDPFAPRLLAMLRANQFALSVTADGNLHVSPEPSAIALANIHNHRADLVALLAAEAAEAESAAPPDPTPVLVDAFDTLALARKCKIRLVVVDKILDPVMPQEILDAEAGRPPVRVEGPKSCVDDFAAAGGMAMLEATECELMAILQCGLVDFTDHGKLASLFSAKHPLPAAAATPPTS